MKTKTKASLISFAVLVMGLISFSFDYAPYYKIKDTGVETEAKIIHLERDPISYAEDGTLLYDRTPIVNYQINGETFINELQFYSILMRSGDVITIVVDSEDPDSIAYNGYMLYLSGFLNMIIIPLVLFYTINNYGKGLVDKLKTKS